MKRKNVITMLIVLNCTIALTLGGCGGAEVSETGSASKSAITYDKGAESDKAKDKAKDKTKDTDKDAKSDKNDKSDKDNKSNKSDKAKDKESGTKTTSTKPSGTKSSGNKSNNSKPSSGNSSKPSSGNSSKPSSGNSSKPSSGNNSGNSSKPSSGNNSGNSSKPAHTHSYSSSVTKQPTCSSAGVRTYTCSCGRSYTESIPATGAHKWKDQYELKKIPAQTHEETTRVDVCYGCGAEFNSPDEAGKHVTAVFGDACSSYYPKYSSHTVVDVPAREENVYVGAKCETCGAWK